MFNNVFAIAVERIVYTPMLVLWFKQLTSWLMAEMSLNIYCHIAF